MITYNKNTAILFIIFNRPNTTQQVFERIREVQPKRLYVAADGPRNEVEQLRCEETRAIVSNIDWDCELHTRFLDENQGCDPHCLQAITWFFENEPEGIVLEDDCLPAGSFFGFCSELLEKYRNDDRIGHITGGNYQFGKNRGNGSYYFSNLTHVWGWASWRRVWQSRLAMNDTFEQLEKLDYLSYLPSHAPFQNYWETYFRLANATEKQCWDFRYAYSNLVNQRLSIIPNCNLISNIGCQDHATHYVSKHPFEAIPLQEMEELVHPTFVCPDIEADLRSQAREYNVNYEDLSAINDYHYLKQRLADAPMMKIPKVIHQIYEDLAGPPEYLLNIAESWKEQNQDWEYRFWNKHDMEAFMQEYYPELIPIYGAFPHNVQRWDAIRYMILYKLGGLYVDMDYECTENITPLLYGVTCGMGLEPFGHNVRSRRQIIVGNAFMASVPGHPFMQELIDTIFYKLGDKIQQMHVMNSTGPFMVTKQYQESRCQDEVTLIPAGLVAPLTQEEVFKVINEKTNKQIEDKVEQAYATHYFFGSWYR